VRPQGAHQGWCASNQAANREHKLRPTARGVPRLLKTPFLLVLANPVLDEGGLAHGMRQLNGVHTQAVIRPHHWVGYVFQGRYKAILVDRDAYLLELARYVVLSPVRAGMVSDAAYWPWSSDLLTIGHDPASPWLVKESWVSSSSGPLLEAQGANVQLPSFQGSPNIGRNGRRQIGMAGVAGVLHIL